MIKKKLPDVLKDKLTQIDGYVTNCVGERLGGETIPMTPAAEGI